MRRGKRSELKEILLELTVLESRLNTLHWEIGEEIPVEKSITISKASTNLKSAIKNLTEVI